LIVTACFAAPDPGLKLVICGVTAVVIRPTEPFNWFENHSAPSAPAAIQMGPEIVGAVKFEIVPDVVMRPMESFQLLTNHTSPAEPQTMEAGEARLAAV
jgi:hypothetical protein